MEKKLHTKILKFLNDQEDILSYVDLRGLVVEHYMKLYRGKTAEYKVIEDEIGSVLKILRDKKYIEFKENKNHVIGVISNGILKEEHFTNFDASPRITLDGVNYLQSEQDAQVTREFIAAQKMFLIEQTKHIGKQTKIIRNTFFISVVSLLCIGYSTYDTFRGGVEEQLKELVKSQKDLRTTLKDSLKYPTNLPLETSTSKSSKTTYK